jgi:hypothetical protein
MKLRVLAGIAHNIADSMASGVGLLIGVYDMDVFGEAAHSPSGAIEIDFLAGRCTEGHASHGLECAASLYASKALPRLCAHEGTEVAAFARFLARFWNDAGVPRCDITIESAGGRRHVGRFYGVPLRRLRTMDRVGRVRTRS